MDKILSTSSNITSHIETVNNYNNTTNFPPSSTFDVNPYNNNNNIVHTLGSLMIRNILNPNNSLIKEKTLNINVDGENTNHITNLIIENDEDDSNKKLDLLNTGYSLISSSYSFLSSSSLVINGVNNNNLSNYSVSNLYSKLCDNLNSTCTIETLTNQTFQSFNTTINGASSQQKPDKFYWALCLILLPFLAIFGNILVIASVYKEKSLQSVTNYFIVSLAFADLLVAAIVMPFAVYYLVSKQILFIHTFSPSLLMRE